MKPFCRVFVLVFFMWIPMATCVFAADVNGVWTKTTSPDPNNITIFYGEKNVLKAIGYSEMGGRKTVWYAEGEIKGEYLRCPYHYSLEALPVGWEQDGVMELTLSDDGNVITGYAKSNSGNWSGNIEFKRAHFVSPALK